MRVGGGFNIRLSLSLSISSPSRHLHSPPSHPLAHAFQDHGHGHRHAVHMTPSPPQSTHTHTHTHTHTQPPSCCSSQARRACAASVLASESERHLIDRVVEVAQVPRESLVRVGCLRRDEVVGRGLEERKLALKNVLGHVPLVVPVVEAKPNQSRPRRAINTRTCK
jgi:hypothetical protein